MLTMLTGHKQEKLQIK